MAMTAREAAWTALQRWRKNGAWSDAALHAVLQNAQLEPRDAALAARICYGTLQNLTLLDHYLSIYCTTPLQKLEPKVLDLLRLSAYQIVLLDKIPSGYLENSNRFHCMKIRILQYNVCRIHNVLFLLNWHNYKQFLLHYRIAFFRMNLRN